MIAIAHIRGAGQHSGIALGDLMALSFTIRNGLIIRQQSFRSKEEALEGGVTVKLKGGRRLERVSLHLDLELRAKD